MHNFIYKEPSSPEQLFALVHVVSFYTKQTNQVVCHNQIFQSFLDFLRRS